MLKKIFIVEDDDNIRELTSYALESQCFDVEAFSEPTEFWSVLKQTEPKLIVLDIMLPLEDGISILKRLKVAEKRHYRVAVRKMRTNGAPFHFV